MESMAHEKKITSVSLIYENNNVVTYEKGKNCVQIIVSHIPLFVVIIFSDKHEVNIYGIPFEVHKWPLES